MMHYSVDAGSLPLSRSRGVSRDWTNQTNAIIEESQANRTLSTKTRENATATKRVLEKQTKLNQASVADALKRKVADTTVLKNKIEKRIASLCLEVDKLVLLRGRGGQLSQGLVRPMRKAETRIHLRDKRPAREKISDSVERMLGEEHTALQSAHQALQALLSDIDRHVVLMNDVRHALKEDYTDKTASLKLDVECLDLPAKAKASSGLGATGSAGETKQHTVAARSANPSKSTTLPSIWRQNTERVIADAARLEHESYEYRRRLVALMKQVEEMRNTTHAAVQDALATKVKNTTHLHSKLSQDLLEVKQELDKLEEQRETVVRTLQGKQGPMAIAKERLELRKHRPSREAVRDPVEEALEEEYAKLSQAVNSLSQKIANIDAETKRQLAAQVQIGQSIRDKCCALNIDKKCLDIDQMSSSGCSESLDAQSSLKTPMQKHRQERAKEFERGRHIPKPPPGKRQSLFRNSAAVVKQLPKHNYAAAPM